MSSHSLPGDAPARSTPVAESESAAPALESTQVDMARDGVFVAAHPVTGKLEADGDKGSQDRALAGYLDGIAFRIVAVRAALAAAQPATPARAPESPVRNAPPRPSHGKGDEAHEAGHGRPRKP